MNNAWCAVIYVLYWSQGTHKSEEVLPEDTTGPVKAIKGKSFDKDSKYHDGLIRIGHFDWLVHRRVGGFASRPSISLM